MLRAHARRGRAEGVAGKRAEEVAFILDRLLELVAPITSVGGMLQPTLPEGTPLPAAAAVLAAGAPALAPANTTSDGPHSPAAVERPAKQGPMPPLPPPPVEELSLGSR